MLRPGRRFTAALLTLVLGACAFPIRTKTEVDPNADFAGFRSYAWMPSGAAAAPAGASHGGYVSPLDEQRIVRAVETELAAKGYRKADRVEESDLVVSYAVGVEEKTRVARYPDGSIKGTPDYGYGEWYSETATRVETHQEGTLTIEFYQRTTKQAVWVGWAQKRLSQYDDPEDGIRNAVAAVLEEFPARK